MTEPNELPDWYSVEEIKRWTEADARGFGDHAEWLAAQLNAAYHKGRMHGSSILKQAIRVLCMDMHSASSRPCETCRLVSNALGEPFGCEARNNRRT